MITGVRSLVSIDWEKIDISLCFANNFVVGCLRTTNSKSKKKVSFPEIFVVKNGIAWLDNDKKAIEHVRCAFSLWTQSNQVSCDSDWGTWTMNKGWYLENLAKTWFLLHYHCMWAKKWLKKLEIEFKKCKT